MLTGNIGHRDNRAVALLAHIFQQRVMQIQPDFLLLAVPGMDFNFTVVTVSLHQGKEINQGLPAVRGNVAGFDDAGWHIGIADSLVKLPAVRRIHRIDDPAFKIIVINKPGRMLGHQTENIRLPLQFFIFRLPDMGGGIIKIQRDIPALRFGREAAHPFNYPDGLAGFGQQPERKVGLFNIAFSQLVALPLP